MRVRQTFRRRSRKESRPGDPTARPHNAISDQPETTDPETMPEQTIPLPADVRYFTPAGPFRLECGAAIPLRIAYHTYGTFTGDNALWVCHALTANSEVADWWPHTVEAGKFLDPARWFTVCANIVGSCYGTTGPASPDPATGKPYYGAFPPVTVRDMARANLLLADHLGIAHARAVIGSSIGGFQALEMALERPGFARKLILIATAARAQPWTIAADEAQRMALEIGDKLGTPAALPGAETSAAPAPTEDAVASEVSAALVGLGWSEAQAAKAIEKLAGSGLGASDMLRAALVTLGGGRG